MVRLYQRRGWWHVDYVLEGVRFRHALRVRSRSDAELLRSKYESEILKRRLQGDLRGGKVVVVTVTELVERFDKWAEAHYSGSEYQVVQSAIRPLLDVAGKKAVGAFGLSDLKAVRERFYAKGWTRKTINGMVSRVRHIFKWGASNELVPPAVCQTLAALTGMRKGDAPEGEPVRPVSEEDMQKTLPELSPVVADIVRLVDLTGARTGEIVIMRPRDLDRSETPWTYRPAHHKTEHHGHDRLIYLGPQAQQIVVRYLLRDAEAFCFVPEGGTAAHYTVGVIRTAIARACRRAGVKTWTPHQLRHKAATRLRKEYGIETARVVLGQRSSAVTELYAEADRGRAAQAARDSG
ncbi:MAG: tyrosine-type recombinase/integrase [bacterium]